MHSCPQQAVGALQNGSEGQFRGGREVADGAEVAGDVLREAHNLLGTSVAGSPGAELAQHTGQEQHLLEVGALVCVNALHESAASERDGGVLVVALAIAQDRVPRKLDLPNWRPFAAGSLSAASIDETRIVPALLLVAHAINHVGLRLRLAVRRVDEGHLQRFFELPEHNVGVLQLNGVEVGVHLHSHHTCEAVARIPREPQLAVLVALRFEMGLQRLVVQHHTTHCAEQSLHAHGRPEAQLVPVLFAVALPIHSSFRPGSAI
mmetsp:Transcript_73861/g.133117  ORF Transcript_73861/g.133117 Transcript_73861/m.133117 type:complete len:263 (-) Transcript_73861:2717-3505(-)